MTVVILNFDVQIYKAVARHPIGDGIKALRDVLKQDRAFNSVGGVSAAELEKAVSKGASGGRSGGGREMLGPTSSDDDDNYDKEGLDRMSSGATMGTTFGTKGAVGAVGQAKGFAATGRDSERGSTGNLGVSATKGASEDVQLDVQSEDVRNETFAFAPDWLFGSWGERGVWGFWDQALVGSPPKQVWMCGCVD